VSVFLYLRIDAMESGSQRHETPPGFGPDGARGENEALSTSAPRTEARSAQMESTITRYSLPQTDAERWEILQHLATHAPPRRAA
jgi:hypothetical protein